MTEKINAFTWATNYTNFNYTTPTTNQSTQQTVAPAVDTVELSAPPPKKIPLMQLK